MCKDSRIYHNGQDLDILWFQDFQHVTSVEDMFMAEWWSPRNSELLVFFDSWDELVRIASVSSAEWDTHRERVRMTMRRRTEDVVRKWRQLLG